MRLQDWMIQEALSYANRACNCGLGVTECDACCMARLADAVEQLTVDRNDIKGVLEVIADQLRKTEAPNRLQFLSQLAQSAIKAVDRP